MVDDHQSPAKPAEYLQLRILPLLNFYKKRLPLYYRIRTCIEFMLILGGLATTLLGFLELESWAPIIAACAGATTAWLEFSDTSKKLARYSDVVHQVSNVVTWWRSLTDVDRANLANIEQLILRSEELFATERQAWLSTSMVAKTLDKHVENDVADAQEYALII